MYDCIHKCHGVVRHNMIVGIVTGPVKGLNKKAAVFSEEWYEYPPNISTVELDLK